MDAHRRGHNFKTVGAEGFIKEVVECDKIHNEIISLYELTNTNNLNVNPPNYYGEGDVNYSIKKANENNADFYYSIHMNASELTNEKRGCEVIVYDNKQLEQAKNVLNNLVKLGFKNRGIKTMKEIGRELGELKRTKMNAMIIEVCFVDSKSDVELYKSLGAKTIAKAIFEGVTSIKVPCETVKKTKFYNGSFEGQKAVVKSDELNVRFDRPINGCLQNKIGTLKKGDKVNLNFCLNGWVSIEGFNGRNGLGYVNAEYLEIL